MNQQRPLELMIADWMQDDATRGLPAVVVDELVATAVRRPTLPRWLAMVREPAMTLREPVVTSAPRVVVGFPRRQLALIAALLLLLVTLAVGGAATVLLRPTASLDDWPGFRGDGSHAGVARRGPIGNPVVAWQFHAGGGIEYDLAVAGDLVLVPSDDGVLHALDIRDGIERWRFMAPDPMRGPYVQEGTVFVADGDGVIHALALADGRERWTAPSTLAAPSDLVVAGGHVIAGTADGLVVAIDASSGLESWRTPVSQDRRPVHSPAATSGVIVAATDGGTIAALDAGSGKVEWRQDLGTDVEYGSPVVGNGVAYLGGGATSPDARLIAFDLASGNELWRVDENVSSPSIAGDRGYTGSAVGRVKAIDLTEAGKEQWGLQFGGVVRAPVVAGDVVYISADGERRLVALDRSSGGRLWSFDLDGFNSCCLAVSRGLILLGTSAGTVYAIGGDGATLTAPSPPPARPSSNASAPPTPAPTRTPTPTVPILATNLAWAKGSDAPDFVPWSLTLTPDGRLWAVEADHDRISVFTTDGEFVESWGTSGSGDGQFAFTAAHNTPYGAVAFAPDGSFYVLDAGNRRVQHFDSERKFLGTWGSFGVGPGEFSNPVGIAVDSEDVVHVLDDIRGVIERYDSTGKILGTTPAFPVEVRPNQGANSLVIGPNGHYYVAVASPNEVVELDHEGGLVATYGGPGSGAGMLHDQPSQMAFDAHGRLYVTHGATSGSTAVSVYDTSGAFVGGFGLNGGGDAELGFPWGIVVTEDGIYVADGGETAFPGRGYTSLLRRFTPISWQ